MNAIPTLTPLAMPCNSSFEAKDWEILSNHWYPVARTQDVFYCTSTSHATRRQYGVI